MKRSKKKFEPMPAVLAIVGGPAANLLIDQLDTRIDFFKNSPTAAPLTVAAVSLAGLYFYPNKNVDGLLYGALGVAGADLGKGITAKLSGFVDDLYSNQAAVQGAKTNDVGMEGASNEKIAF